MLVFALIIGAVFLMTYQSQNQNAVTDKLVQESNFLVSQIDLNSSDLISESIVQTALARINIEDARIFFIDVNGDIQYLTTHNLTGMGMMRSASRLSEQTQSALFDVFAGEQVTTEEISGFFNSDAITVGTPVIVANNIVGGLFVSATTQSISALANTGFEILLTSLGFGLLIAVGLGLILSSIFTKPLELATESIQMLAEGNYNLKPQTKRKDEMGVLQCNLVNLSDELKSARDAQNNLEKMRQNFIADITHELRTPVTVIRGLTEGLQDGVYTQNDVIPQILKESKDMQRLINDLLELSKLEDPEFKVDKQRFEYHELISDVLRSAQELVKVKHQKILLTQDEKLLFGQGDTQRLKQMLLAIIHNATKFSNEKAVISIALGQRKEKVVISISDQGKGMTQDQVKELFVRYKKDTENNPDGNGLGLLIVEKIAQKHDIKIEVESQLNEGTTFRFIAKEAKE
mgnify:CR=1 FL=1